MTREKSVQTPFVFPNIFDVWLVESIDVEPTDMEGKAVYLDACHLSARSRLDLV